MSLTPTDIAEAFATRAENLPSIASSVVGEPAGLPELPAVTVMWRSVGVVGQDTGGVDLEWTWRVLLYVPMAAGVEEAQDAAIECVPELFLVTVDEPKLGLEGDGLDWAELEDDRSELSFDRAQGYAVKAFTLRARYYQPRAS